LAVGSHLTDPTAPAVETAATTAVSLDDVRAAYRFLREDREVRAFIGSMFYPHRLLYRFAESTVGEFSADLGRLQRLMTGRPVLSRTVEIHPSKGTCNYGCVMCLWSDKRSLTYATQGLQANGLLTTSDWTRLLDELRAGGVEALVLSGGGEVLLNRDVVTILPRVSGLTAWVAS